MELPGVDFHPSVLTWFEEQFGEATLPQQKGWPLIQGGGHVLISAPTGSGKTLAAFLSAVDQLVQEGICEGLEDTTQVLYISPLKALANDIQKNLLQPLAQIRETAARMGLQLPEIRPLVRTGDTLAHERQRMIKKPPHILVTTPESLFILLTSSNGQKMLSRVRTVIVDEIHALADDKRGSHLAVSLERLEALTGRVFQRIGLSATQKPIETIARFLTGLGRTAAVVNVGHRRQLDLAVEVPADELSAVATNEMWDEIYDRLTELIHQHRTTLIFVNTRRLAERVSHQLVQRVGEGVVAAHHGSLSREIRLKAEEQLKEGALKAVVATASLELGIDIGTVDLVCQIGSPRSIRLALQRVGRSGHWKGAVPKGRFFTTTRDELVECAALVWAIQRGGLDEIRVPNAPKDILAQQIVASAATQEWEEDRLFELVQRAMPYEGLPRAEFDAVVTMLSEGISTRHGRRGAYLHRDRVNGKIRGRRGAGLAAMTSGGAIPDNANYLVKADPEETLVGTLDEDFAVESMRGDIFLLGNTSWRIRRVEAGVVRVENAQGAPPNVPFWRGEAPGRTPELSAAFSAVREKICHLERPRAQQWLQKECGLDRRGSEQAVDYVLAGREALGTLPTQSCIVAERFFDEGGGMQLILHSPLGSHLNKAWGLALRKRFCRSFNMELQAAATENGVLISLSEHHSFPLDSVFAFLSSQTVREVLVQAVLAVPLFPVRWRWNASRALAVLRFSGGRKVPPPLQRMRADDLLAAVFPEQVACLEHIQGDITVPKHPLVDETVRDCLTEALDLESLSQVLRRIEAGTVRCVAIDTREPSPFCHEILNANPYAFLDDAPLEERRSRAVQTRRSLPETADELGALDAKAIEQVGQEAWPPARDLDEVHDALLTLGLIPESELSGQIEMIDSLVGQRRAGRLVVPGEEGTESSSKSPVFFFATERIRLARKVHPEARVVPSHLTELDKYAWERDQSLISREEVVREILRCRLECTGPTTCSELACLFSLPDSIIEVALLALESEGQILRGAFRDLEGEREWCDRRLLARIHRLTLGRLRREIEPVSPAQFMSFLFRWQHTAGGTTLHGEKGLSVVLEQLQGFEAAATAWESSVLPGRVGGYDAALLDKLCLSGEFVWARLSIPSSLEMQGSEEKPVSASGVRPSRIAPLAFFRRDQVSDFLALRQSYRGEANPPAGDQALNLSHSAREVLDQLKRWGACFFEDLVRTTDRLPIQVEEGLWELVAAGLVTADGFDNLRSLVDPKRKRGRRRSVSGRVRLRRLGRWSLLRLPGKEVGGERLELEPQAGQLLQRWGIVFRDLLARESLNVPWRDLLAVYRKLEARGEVRGGRFVSGFLGEQFALPEALEALRTLRRSRPSGEVLRISAADPLNLAGIITPGARIRPHPRKFLYYRDGVPVDEEEFLLTKSNSLRQREAGRGEPLLG